MALPTQPWEWAVFKTVRVHIDSHVEFEGHRYSAPNALVGQVLELRVTAHVVEMLHRGQRAVSYTHLDVYKRQAQAWIKVPSTLKCSPESNSCSSA